MKRKRSQGTKSQPTCSICHKKGHYASSCNRLAQRLLAAVRQKSSTVQISTFLKNHSAAQVVSLPTKKKRLSNDLAADDTFGNNAPGRMPRLLRARRSKRSRRQETKERKLSGNRDRLLTLTSNQKSPKLRSEIPTKSFCERSGVGLNAGHGVGLEKQWFQKE